MTNKHPAILRAEKLRAIISMPEYSELIGAWIEESHRQALHDLTVSKDPNDFLPAQGAYAAIDHFKDKFDRVWQGEKKALELANKKLEDKND